MKTVTFSIHTQQPLLATSFQGDPNSDVSYSYILGSMIRGAIIGRYMRQRNLSELDLTTHEVRSLFFDVNSTRYLNAYLLSQEGKRTLPVPRSWFKEKDEELTDNSSEIMVYDFSVDRGDELDTPKFVGKDFWTTERNYVRFYETKRRINIHNQRDRKKGRSVQPRQNDQTKQIKGEGELFRYNAIDAGQTFQAIVLCDEVNVELLINLLRISEDLWLGGSRSAGYGHTKIGDLVCQDIWNETGLPANKRVNHSNLTITLLSDLILRDKWGQYAVIPPSERRQNDSERLAPLTRVLEEKLGVKLESKASFASSTLIGGFNQKWGLPLPQTPALAAGSVFIFNKISLTLEQIQQLETEGIGERRVDGFGRVVINWLEEESFQAKLPALLRRPSEPTLRVEASRSLAAQMAARLLQQKLDQQLQKTIGYLSIQGEISNSQLSRLQILARQALPTGDCDLVLSLLKNLPSNATNQYEQAKIIRGSVCQPLKQQLEQWLRQPISWIVNPQDLTVKVANIERSVTDELTQKDKLIEKCTLRLIMAVAKKATKERN